MKYYIFSRLEIGDSRPNLLHEVMLARTNLASLLLAIMKDSYIRTRRFDHAENRMQDNRRGWNPLSKKHQSRFCSLALTQPT